MRGVCAVAVLFERRVCGVECLGWPIQIARDQRDLCLGNDTPRTGDGLSRAEGTGRASQQCFGAVEFAELRHRDAAQRQCGASSRKATWFSAPRASPDASARAAAVISESIEIPTHLSLPALRRPAFNLSHINARQARRNAAGSSGHERRTHYDDTFDGFTG